MSTKNDAEVIINGKVYRLSGYESPEYLQKIATYVNKKINSFAAEENYSRLSQEMKESGGIHPDGFGIQGQTVIRCKA